jgi:hypothetical protein
MADIAGKFLAGKGATSDAGGSSVDKAIEGVILPAGKPAAQALLFQSFPAYISFAGFVRLWR